MMVEILNVNSKKWYEYLELMPEEYQDIYFLNDYYRIHQDEGTAKCFFYKSKNKFAMYPFLLNEITCFDIGKGYFDIQSAYGYGGPIANTDDSVFLKDFEAEFINYSKEKNIIAEFIRFHPLLCNHNMFTTNITVVHNRFTVALDLKKKIEDIWIHDIKSKNRNIIRKAIKSNLTVEQTKSLKEFRNLYFKTMKKVRADKYYYFNDRYFREIKKNKHFININVLFNNRVIASAIFIMFKKYFHYHLAGSNKDYLNLAPNNFLLWEAIKYANEKGYRWFHFGGGITNSKNDSLYKFKSKFSDRICNFYIGKRVHNENVYKYLIKKWEKEKRKKAEILLQYRYK